MPALVVTLSLAAACSHRDAATNTVAATAPTPAAPPAAPPAAGPGPLHVGVPGDGTTPLHETTLVHPPAFARLRNDRLEVLLFNDQATGVSCATRLSTGERPSGDGWVVRLDTFPTPVTAPAAAVAARAQITEPHGDSTLSSNVDTTVTITRVDAQSVEGRIVGANAAGDTFVRGTFVAQRCP